MIKAGRSHCVFSSSRTTGGGGSAATGRGVLLVSGQQLEPGGRGRCVAAEMDGKGQGPKTFPRNQEDDGGVANSRKMRTRRCSFMKMTLNFNLKTCGILGAPKGLSR